MRTERLWRAAARVLVCAAFAWPSFARAQAGIYGFTADDGTVTLSNVPSDKRYKLILRDPLEYKLRDTPAHRLASAPREAPGVARSPLAARASSALGALPYHAEVTAAADAHGVEAALIHAVIKTESAYHAGAVSRKGAIGLMQLMPDTARRYGVRDSRDPRQNIDGGTRYLNDLMELFGGDLALVLAAYNAGENAVLRHGRRIPPYAETVQYVPRVLDLYRRYVRAVDL